MKITTNREALADKFALAATFAPNRSPKDILKYVRLEASNASYTLEATDMEKGISITGDCECESDGATLLPQDRMSLILRESSGDLITIASDDVAVTVTCGSAQFELPSAKLEEYPRPLFELNDGATVSVRMLQQIVHLTSYCTDADSARFALAAINLATENGELLSVGTDGRRLAYAAIECDQKLGDAPLLVPGVFAKAIEKLAGDDVLICSNANAVFLHTDSIKLTSRLVEGRFPAWRQVIPNTEGGGWNTATVNAKVLRSAISQATITGDKETRGVCLDFGDELRAYTKTADFGAADITAPVEYEGDPVTVKVDSKYMLDFLKIVDDKTVKVRVKDGKSPVLMNLSDQKYIYVVMPMAND